VETIVVWLDLEAARCDVKALNAEGLREGIWLEMVFLFIIETSRDTIGRLLAVLMNIFRKRRTRPALSRL